MRISTITNWAYGITVILTALSAAAFIMEVSVGTVSPLTISAEQP